MLVANQVRTKVEVAGPLYTAPQYKLTKGEHKYPVCKLIFPIRCTGEGEINDKDYWLQVITFGELAKQVQALIVGEEVVCIGKIIANRWVSTIDGTKKASQQILAFRVGHRDSLSGPWIYFPGAAKKKTAEAVLPLGGDGPEDEDGSEAVDDGVAEFLHG